jgi:hypothetical protein
MPGRFVSSQNYGQWKTERSVSISSAKCGINNFFSTHLFQVVLPFL